MKLIAEPWDCGGYQVGGFPNWDIWAEWNGMYRDVVRRFIKGDVAVKAEFATRLAGSADLYHTNKRCAAIASGRGGQVGRDFGAHGGAVGAGRRATA